MGNINSNAVSKEEVPSSWIKEERNLRGMFDDLEIFFTNKYGEEDGFYEFCNTRYKIIEALSKASLFKNDELYSFVAYHLLIWSTPPYEQCSDFDLPGSYSIKKCLSECLKSIKSSERVLYEV